VSTNKAKHATARDNCHSWNAELVSISDVAENEFVKDMWSVH